MKDRGENFLVAFKNMQETTNELVEKLTEKLFYKMLKTSINFVSVFVNWEEMLTFLLFVLI